jgi:hypothetical protein
MSASQSILKQKENLKIKIDRTPWGNLRLLVSLGKHHSTTEIDRMAIRDYEDLEKYVNLAADKVMRATVEQERMKRQHVATAEMHYREQQAIRRAQLEQLTRAVYPPVYGQTALGVDMAWTDEKPKKRGPRFWRINDRCEEGVCNKEPLDELRVSVSRWLGKSEE